LPGGAKYNAINKITQVTEPSGQTVTLGYDALGQMNQVVLPDGTIAQGSTYDAAGNLISVTDSLGNVTRYAYDADRRLILTTYADGSTESRTYDLAGELVELTDQLGNSTRYVYDAGGRQIQVIDALGGISRIQYDADGRIVARTDPLGRTTHFQYDADGQQVATIAPDGSATRNVYDADRRLVQIIDAAGNVATDGYDPKGNLISVTDALGNVTRYKYNDDNERVAIIDALGNTTSFSYDLQGHIVAGTQPEGETDTSTYDSSGQLASTTNGDGQTIRYAYDVNGRLSSLTFPDNSLESYTYTSDGLLSSVTDANGTTLYEYDPVMRRLVRVTEPDGRYIRYAYDADGDRTLLADSMGAGLPEDVTQYTYDALRRLVQVTDAQGGVTSYSYDADGNLITTSLPNGITQTDTYDTRNRLIAIVDQNAGGATLSSFSYTLDANGNRTREVDLDGSAVVYTYDALKRVTSEEHIASSGLETGAEVYTYDALGNVIARSGTLLGNANFSYNGNNQLLSGAGSTYTYDGAGNMVSVTDSTGKVTRYSYDARRRLIGLQAPDGSTSSYTYDFQGIRQSQQGPGGLDKYLVDELFGASAAQVIRESDSTGATLQTYVLGRGLLSFAEGGNVGYYLTDGLGSTRALTDQTGAVTDTYSYSAYGVVLRHGGSSDNPFQFAGQALDQPSGLVYLRARYYDPATGRFLSKDAFAGSYQLPLSLNKYLYASANPVNHTDPSGNEDIEEVEESQIISEELDEEEAESENGDVQQAFQLENRVFQVDGALLTIYTVGAAALDRKKVGGYFGGLVIPASAGILGGLSEFGLITTAYRMLDFSTKYALDPGFPPNQYAEVFPESPPPHYVYLGELYFTFNDFPNPGSPMALCKVGALVHEFSHLALDQIGDFAYEAPSFYLPFAEALTNADNYRLAVQGITAGLTAQQALESLAPTNL
jgi:RHS repeat-associated protein